MLEAVSCMPEPEHIVAVVGEIVTTGVVVDVTANVLGELVYEQVRSVTLMFPLVVPAVTVILVVP